LRRFDRQLAGALKIQLKRGAKPVAALAGRVFVCVRRSIA
jgi:hypothetical protein